MKNLFGLLLAAGLLAGAHLTSAQAPPGNPRRALDSLQARLVLPATPDTVRVQLYLARMRYFGPAHTAEALAEGQRALTLARRIGYRYGETYLLWALGETNFYHGDNLVALRYFRQAQQLAQGSSQAAPLRLKALEGIADVHTLEHRFALAQVAYLELQPQYATRPLHQQANLENKLTTLYLEWHDAGGAPDSVSAAALRHARRTLAAYRQLGNPAFLAGSYDGLGEAFRAVGQPDSALMCFGRTVALARLVGDPYTLCLGLYHLAETRQQRGQAQTALAPALEAARLAHEAGQAELDRKSQQLLAAIYEALGQLLLANQALRRYTTAQDTLSNQERRATLARLSVEFDTERKESRIRGLEQRQRLQQAEAARQQARLWGLLGGLGLLAAGLAVAGSLTLRLRRSRAALTARNEQLAQARATQDRLYSIIGHDLRTPLTALEGLATLIDYYYQPAHADPAAMQEITAEVRQATSQLTGLLDNLLHWAASQSGELAYRPEALDAPALLEESAALYAPAARARQVTVQVAAAPPALPALWADRNMVLTQLRNLLGNALKASPPGTVITLAAEATGGEILLRVADAGPGLSAAQLAALEQAVGQDSLAARLPGQRGTGLGLPLVRQLARRQHGTLQLASEPGQGTTATLGLPAAGQRQQQAPAA